MINILFIHSVGAKSFGIHDMENRKLGFVSGCQAGYLLPRLCDAGLGAAQVIFVVNVLWSMRYGPRVDDPWSEQLSAMPAPEFNGLPARPPTPTNVGGTAVEARPDGGRVRTVLARLSPTALTRSRDEYTDSGNNDSRRGEER